MLSKIIPLIFIILSTQAFSSIIAVIDSGTDMQHERIASHAWINSGEVANNNRDEDRNGYQDDVYGWNFAENNNLVIDYKYIGTFSQDVYTFFDIQLKYILGQATAEEISWMRGKFKDQKFVKEVGVFGNFIHGTHVAGITLNDQVLARLMAVKLIPTEVKLPGQDKSHNKDKGFRMGLVKVALDKLAATQMDMMAEIGTYINNHAATVANCSFGTGYNQAKAITGMIFKGIFWRDAKEQELNEVTHHFLSALIKEAKRMTEAAPNTLYVFAAGNDGSNNDILPTSPTNVRADNAITVAATRGRWSIASFSNYGKELVDVAAPGVGIRSSIPGNEYLAFSGTSQAAPYVANAAAAVQLANPGLNPAQVKYILMNTVDLKGFLTDVTKSGGIVNRNRAVYAAQVALRATLDVAVVEAGTMVADIAEGKSSFLINEPLFVFPLNSNLIVR